jgi:ferredoxin
VARTVDDRPFAEESLALIRKLSSARAHIFYTAADTSSAQPLPGEFVHFGRPTSGALAEAGVTDGADAYVCGPAGFMAAMADLLGEIGLGHEQIHSEAFGASTTPGAGTSIPAHSPPGEPGNGPEITFAHSGLIAPFSDRYHNLLEFVEACDVPVHWSCRTGVCQSCRTPMIAGSVDYNPQPLDPPGNTEVLLCCAQPTSAVVLDL